jgi:hypothetical protein
MERLPAISATIHPQFIAVWSHDLSDMELMPSEAIEHTGGHAGASAFVW